MNPFMDQRIFMEACDQTTHLRNEKQFDLYRRLIEEEVSELNSSTTPVDQLDALIDIIVVSIGAIHSMGADAEGAWSEVMKTNFAKIDWETKKVRKREDGKVLKPENWCPPQLEQYLTDLQMKTKEDLERERIILESTLRVFKTRDSSWTSHFQKRIEDRIEQIEEDIKNGSYQDFEDSGR